MEATIQIDLEAQRAELAAVLHSVAFTRAPRLAHLLTYLCEKSFAGESHQIKEYSVGVEVFGRGADFDQNSDSIVRVEANRLRKRLAEYYAGPGAAHAVHITIPLGQYVPRFSAAEPASQPDLPQPANEVPIPSEAHAKPHSMRSLDPFLHRTGGRAWLLVAALTLLVVVLSWALWHFRPTRQFSPATGATQPAAWPAASELGPPIGDEIRILAGSSRSFVDHAGKLWEADHGFEGGNPFKSVEQHIYRTQNPDFYRTSRQGSFRYSIPLKKGTYELRLHFAETVYDPDATGTGGEGSRIFGVRANGRILLTHFDLVADAGASRTADVKVFTDIAPAADGLLHLEFTGENSKQATLSAIEILPGFRGHIRPVRLLARTSPYYSNDSHWWSPDNYFQGGQIATYATPVSGTDDPELYETERWGNFSYAIPVTPGRYTVTLYFAARNGNWNPAANSSDEAAPPVAHRFDVYCNGSALLKNFNLADEAAHSNVVVRKFANLEANAQGKLQLNFVPIEGYATVTGIEVLPQ